MHHKHLTTSNLKDMVTVLKSDKTNNNIFDTENTEEDLGLDDEAGAIRFNIHRLDL